MKPEIRYLNTNRSKLFLNLNHQDWFNLWRLKYTANVQLFVNRLLFWKIIQLFGPVTCLADWAPRKTCGFVWKQLTPAINPLDYHNFPQSNNHLDPFGGYTPFSAGWWFGNVWKMTYFSIQLGMSSSQLTNSYFSEGQVNHQPVDVNSTNSDSSSIISKLSLISHC